MKSKIVGDMTNSELIDFVIELQEELGRTERKLKRREILLDKIYEKCEINEGIHDYDVWVKLRYVWDELDNFVKDELGYFHPALTENYKARVKNAIRKIMDTTRDEMVMKQDILDMIDIADERENNNG